MNKKDDILTFEKVFCYVLPFQFLKAILNMQVGLVKFMTTTGEKEKVEGSNNNEREEMNESQASVNGVSSPPQPTIKWTLTSPPR